MRAVVIDKGSLHVRDYETPLPKVGQVLVAVSAAGLNGADMMQRRGLYPAPIGWPQDIPGLEFSGVVEALGEGVTTVAIGDRVMGIVGGGAQATHVVTDASTVLLVPDHVDLVVAGGFPEAFTTAFDAIVNQGFLLPGERLLVTGAAGGVGTAAIQIGHLLGAEVIACARDVQRHAALIELGATTCITPEQVSEAGPYDVVVELVGAASLEGGVLQSLDEFARLVIIGISGGTKAEVDLFQLMTRRATLTGSTLRGRDVEEKTALAQALSDRVLPALADGRLIVPILGRYRLNEVEQAYERFGEGSKLGKIILEN